MESFKFVGANFRGFSTCADSWGRNLVERGEGVERKNKITTGKF